MRSNLDERIDYLSSKDMTPQDAFQKATNELGDITPLAEEMSLKRKQEVYANMYMKTKNYISTWRMVAYFACGGVFLFGIIVALLGWLNSGQEVAGLGVMIPFGALPISAAVFLALTQETVRKNPMGWKRALIYAVAVAGFLFGIVVFVMMFFVDNDGLPTAIATLIPFCLPCALVVAFLILTEKDRNKPWVIEQQNAWIKHNQERFADPATESRYGLLCGALWIFSIAIFVALGFFIGFKFSWIVFIFSIGFQLLIEYKFSNKKATTSK